MAIRGTLSIKKARKLLKYKPKFGIVEGFEKYYRGIENYMEQNRQISKEKITRKKPLLSMSVVKKIQK